jgi:hypothetical protein
MSSEGDLFFDGALFVVLLLLCVLTERLVRVARLGWERLHEFHPSPEMRVRSAVLRLEAAGVDVPGILGEWSPPVNALEG